MLLAVLSLFSRHKNIDHSEYVCYGCQKTFTGFHTYGVSTWPITVHLSWCADLPTIDTDAPYFARCLSILSTCSLLHNFQPHGELVDL
jgi:hypothetical protein